MARFWLRWGWRDFRSRWVQVVATALVLAIGVGGFAGMRGVGLWQVSSLHDSLAALHADNLRVDLADGTVVPEGRLLGALQRVRGNVIAAAQERLVVPSQLEVSHGGQSLLVAAELVGVPGHLASEPVNAVAIKAGGSGPVVLDRNFASYYRLPDRGRVRIAGLGNVAYDGVGVSPQYFVVVDGAGVSGAENGLAVAYLPLAQVQRASGHPGAVNQLLVRTRSGANLTQVERSVRAAFSAALPRVPVTMTAGPKEPSTQAIVLDARNDQKTNTMYALLLLLGAAVAAFNLVTRVVEAQRREIGIGMALGAPRSLLARRPLVLGLQIGLLGALLGVPFGIGLADMIEGLRRAAQPMPVYASLFPVGLYAEAMLIAIVVAVLAAALPVWRAVRVHPVDAVRAGFRTTKGGAPARLLGRLHFPGGAISQLPLRNLARSPRRSLMTILGLGAVMTVTVAVFGMVDSIGNASGRALAAANAGAPARLDVALSGFEPSNGPLVRAIAGAPGVQSAEPSLTVPATVRSSAGELPIVLELVDPHSAVWHPTAVRGTLAGQGVVLSEKAASDLGVSLGNSVELDHPTRSGGSTTMSVTRVRVTGIHSNPVRAYAYMDSTRAGALGLSGLANEVRIVPAPGIRASRVEQELFGRPGIASVQPAGTAADALKATVTTYSGAIQIVVFITLALGLLVAFTSASVSLEERRREYATMFAFGLPPKSGLRVAVVEGLVLGTLGTIVGFGLGLAAAGWIVTSVLSGTFPGLGFQTTLTSGSVLTTALVGVGSMTLAPLFTFRRMRRMNVPSTLRVME